MHLVVTAAGQEREVDVVLDDADATVGDLVAVVTPGAPTGIPLTVDGRPVSADHRLDEVGLVEGARLGVGDPTLGPVAVEPANRAVAVVGGIDSGRSVPFGAAWSIVVGRHPECDLVVDDPAVSAQHARLDLAADGSVVVHDLGSSNGTEVDGVRIEAATPVGPGTVVGVGETQLEVRTVSLDDRPVGARRGQLGPGGVVPFNRPPRPSSPEARPPRKAPDAPGDPTRRTPFNVAMVVAPLVMGGVMVAVTREPRFALFIMLSPIMAVGSWFTQKRQAKKDNKTSTKDHKAAIEALDRDLRSDADVERRRRTARLPDPAEVVRRALAPSVKLWERRPAHDDVLHLRAGVGAVPWQPVEAPPAAEHPLLTDLLERHGVLRRCPVEVDLSNGGVVGIVGHRATALAVARSLLCQAAVGQGPADLPVAICASQQHAGAWDWAKWLPHVRDPAGAFRALAGDRETSDSLLAAMLAPADDDRNRRPTLVGGRDRAVGPSRLLVLDDVSLLEGRRAPARSLLAGNAGTCAGIVVAPTEDQLPAMCNTVIVAPEPGGIIEVRRPMEGERLTEVVPAGVSVPTARAVARALARWEDPELGVAGAGLPSVVRLLPLLGLDDPDPTAIVERWARNPVDPPPATPIGVGERGPVVIDLASDGPHTLIGGTTGSGKSELLRSLVAGLAAGNDPDHLVFVLVDYKGGSAFDECAQLPHTVGMVTDLDESLGERALRSLEAELRRREHVLRDAGTQDLPAYLAAGSTLGPLPRLVVVVDEFATLATELPDFLGALVGVAQRGRSLGVHLVLATQRPQGAVNANIKANTNLRIALRVQDPQDSTDIIDRPDAASISRTTPGRAQVRSGPGEVEPVQTALSTAGAPGGPAQPVRVLPFLFGPAPLRVAADAGEDRPSDLHLLVVALTEAVARQGRPAPLRPWLPMLDEQLTFDAIAEAAAANEPDPGVVAFGVADEPDHQRQVPVGWRLADGHLTVTGMVGSGTSTTLLAVARALAERWSPDDLHLYGIDFGAGSLGPLAHLPHTGSVLGAVDREGQIRLIRFLRGELDRRRGLTAAEQATEARIVILLDGAAGFLAEHEGGLNTELIDGLRRLFGEGPGVGILFAVAGERSNALPQRVAGTIDQRIVLRLPDPVDYSQIGVRLREAPKLPPGRGWHSNGPRVLQIADPGDLGALGPALAARYGPPTRAPRAMGSLPVRVLVSDLVAAGATVSVGATTRVPVGIGDAELEPAVLELHRGDHILVTGPARSGKTSALALLASQLAPIEGTIVVAVCEEGSPLEDIEELSAHGTVDFLADVLRAAPTDERPWFVLVDDAIRVPDHEGVLSGLFASGRAGLHVAVAARTEELRSSLTHWSRPVRAGRTGLLIQPDLQLDGDIFSSRLPRSLASPLRPGRGFVVTGGDLALAQFALPDPAAGGPDLDATLAPPRAGGLGSPTQ